MDKLIIKKHPPCYFAQLGREKTFFILDNADWESTILFYFIYHYKSFEYDNAVDCNFWYDFIDFFCLTYNVKRNIKFSNANCIPISKRKITEERLFYSGGKDSEFSRYLNPKIPRIQIFNEENYRDFTKEKIISNADNLFWLNKKKSWNNYRIEMLLPFLSPYKTNYVGIEKEFWDYSNIIYGFDIEVFQKLLSSHDLFYDSLVKDYYSVEIVDILYNENESFVKCNKTEKTFCYHCMKCYILYCSGLDKPLFEREQVEKNTNKKNPHELIKLVKSVGGKYGESAIILEKVYNKFMVGKKYDIS